MVPPLGPLSSPLHVVFATIMDALQPRLFAADTSLHVRSQKSKKAKRKMHEALQLVTKIPLRRSFFDCLFVCCC